MNEQESHEREIAEAAKKIVVAQDVAKALLEVAKQEAAQMLYNANLDVSKVNLICNKIVSIQTDIVWIKRIVIGTMTGVGGIIVAIIVGIVTKK